MSDQFVREIEEDLRREQAKKLWDRYGLYLIGVAVLIVAGTAGYRGWQAFEARKAATNGDRFIAALEAANGEGVEEARAALSGLEDQSGAYGMLAKMRLAALEAEDGSRERAIELFAEVANDGSVDQPIRDLAALRGAYLEVDTADYADLLARVEPLAAVGTPYRHSAREVLAMSAYRSGNFAESRKWLDLMNTDAETPQNARVRAGLLLALIAGQIGGEDDDAAADGASDTNG